MQKFDKQNLDQELKAPDFIFQYQSREERACSRVMERFLDWKPKMGVTYQRPLTEKHDTDFCIPQQNAIIEYHPPVIKWYGAKGVYRRLQTLGRHLSDHEFTEVQDIVATQISHDYFQRRRLLMDRSPFDDIRQMRLILATDSQEVYNLIVKPYATQQVRWEKFKQVWDRGLKEKNGN